MNLFFYDNPNIKPDNFVNHSNHHLILEQYDVPPTLLVLLHYDFPKQVSYHNSHISHLPITKLPF